MGNETDTDSDGRGDACDDDDDNDGMLDSFEALYTCLNPLANDAGLDPDGDGLTNLEEFQLWETLGLNTDPCKADTDSDGYTDGQELAMGFNPNAWYDFYDVPIPTNDDPTPNGTKNGAVNMQNVVGVLKYVVTSSGEGANGKGVDYNSLKDGDWSDGARQVMFPHGVVDDWDKVGRQYDRGPSPPPTPPYDAGPPNGAVNFQDVVMVLRQVGLDCSGPP